ncbi:hypothetical protein GCM10027162_23620 [Streptomyces incanus]
MRFEPGGQLLLYTDGVAETRDEDGRFHPLGERTHLLNEPDTHRALDALREDLVGHAGGPPGDDAAMLLLRHHRHGDGNPPPPGG